MRRARPSFLKAATPGSSADNPDPRRGSALARTHERIRSVNPEENLLVAEAGVVLKHAQTAPTPCSACSPEPRRRRLCTIGGNVLDQCRGVNVLRYGMMRDLVLGLEVVLADDACSISCAA